MILSLSIIGANRRLSLFWVPLLAIALVSLWISMSLKLVDPLADLRSDNSWYVPVVNSTATNATMTTTKGTVAYAITITSCPSGENNHDGYLDGATVLQHSVHRSSTRHPSSGSKYDYQMYAFVHPSAVNCTKGLVDLGYQVQIRPVPVPLAEIRGGLKDVVESSSCCGSAEFLKLYSYTLTDHPVAVHLDTDMLILQPLDDLFDVMLQGPDSPARARIPAMWVNTTADLPETIDAFFTRDYNLVRAGRLKPRQIGIQGGFLVVRPNLDTFEEYRQVILEGNYTKGSGWGGEKLAFGGYYGAAQIQGLCAYYYGHVHTGTSVELNRCYYNNMADNPREPGLEKRCRTMQSECPDCRLTNWSDIRSVHFTICQKPWSCRGTPETPPFCLEMHRRWFEMRYLLETEWTTHSHLYNITAQEITITSNFSKPWMVNDTYGYCLQDGEKSYIPMVLPSQSEV